MSHPRLSRRWFALALSGAGLSTVVSCATSTLRQRPEDAASNGSAANGSTNGSSNNSSNGASAQHASMAASTPPATPQSAREQADAMDAHHEERTKAFPAKTEGVGNQSLKPTLDGVVKVFDLVASVIQWEVEPGKKAGAWVYNKQLPGPEIRVTEGDKVRINLHNELPESTSIHWHGLITPNSMDGVPFITQPPIKPGETFTYEFVAKPVGSHMYHSHHDSTKQVGLGLLGAFIVEPKDPTTRPAFDKEYTMILNDGAQGFTITGKSFPATQPLTAKLGQKVLIRFMNEGVMIHPMHLHGMPMQVIAKDGYLLPQPYFCDTLNISPGDRWDVIVDADNPGTWAFHCHILPHAEGEMGMFGMVTAMIVEP